MVSCWDDGEILSRLTLVVVRSVSGDAWYS